MGVIDGVEDVPWAAAIAVSSGSENKHRRPWIVLRFIELAVRY